MSPSSGGSVLRGARAQEATFARLGGELRGGSAGRYGVDPRLADPVLEQAFSDAVGTAREDARQQGYADGHRAGALAAAAQAAAVQRERDREAREHADLRDEVVGRVLETLLAAADELAQRQAVSLREDVDLLLRTAVDLAEVLVGDHLRASDEPGLDAVRRALSAVSDDATEVRLHLHPRDAQALDRDSLADLAAGVRVHVVGDPAVEPGGCVAQAGATTVDAQMSAAIARVRSVLTA